MSDTQLDSPLEVTLPDEPSHEVPTDVSTAPAMVEVEISKFFGFRPGDPIESTDSDYMHTIWNYYAEGAKSPGDVIRRISEAERQIEPPRPGETRIGKFYTFVRLLEDEKSIKDEINAYKK